MKKIIFSCLVEIENGESDSRITDVKELRSYDNLTYEDELFSDYFSDGGDSTLVDARVSGGTLSLKFDPTSNKLFAIVEYDLQRDLTEQELEILVDYTGGQLSDGIGGNFGEELEQDRDWAMYTSLEYDYDNLNIEFVN